MRFGFCAPPEDFDTLKEIGYDYAEWPVAQALAPEEPDNAVMPALIEKIGASSFKPQAFYLFLPGDLKVVGPDIDLKRQKHYLENAIARVAALGGEVIGFGSGRARQIPDGFPKKKACEQMIDFLRLAAPVASKHGVAIAIEPLSPNECNFIHSVAEAVAIAEEVDSPAIGVLSDLHHVSEQGQSYEETRLAGRWLAHVHVAGFVDRRAPTADDIPRIAEFFSALKAANYQGRVSMEGRWTDLPREGAVALESLRMAWDAA